MRISLALLLIFLPCMLTHVMIAQTATVTVRVITPPTTPAGSQIFIAGNDARIGNWRPDSIALTQESDSVWSLSLAFQKDADLQFKITRGSWDAEAIYAEGVVPADCRLTVDRDTIITLRPITWRDANFTSSIAGGITGNVRYHRALEGRGLRYKRDLIIWLPPSYETDSARRYPVLYMHDGQNVFDPATSFRQIDWRADEVSDSLIRAGAMEEILIVGITNSPDRREEYDDTPLGENYRRFIIDVAKPLVDSLYRTKPDRANTGTMGSSMGGTISFLMVWKHPEVFSKSGCLSPAFFPRLLQSVRDDTVAGRNVRIYMDNGGIGLELQLQSGCDAMLEMLAGKGYRMNDDLLWFKDERAEHTEQAWSERLWRPLLFMFGR